MSTAEFQEAYTYMATRIENFEVVAELVLIGLEDEMEDED
jgi:hypothetical protein